MFAKVLNQPQWEAQKACTIYAIFSFSRTRQINSYLVMPKLYSVKKVQRYFKYDKKDCHFCLNVTVVYQIFQHFFSNFVGAIAFCLQNFNERQSLKLVFAAKKRFRVTPNTSDVGMTYEYIRVTCDYIRVTQE